MKTNKITPKYIDKVRDKLKSIIDKENLGINVSFGSARYDSDTFTIKLKVSLPSIAVSFAFASLKSLPPNSSIALYSSR